MALLLLGALTGLVCAGWSPLLETDRAVRDAFRDASSHAGWLDAAMRTVADLGGPVPGALAVIGSVGSALVHRARATTGSPWRTAGFWRPALVALGAVLLVGTVVVMGKIAVGRHGPSGAAPDDGAWGWYPSGHTATSAVCFGLAALLVRRITPRHGRTAAVVAAVVCAAVGVSLLWCDYHWASDVVASWALCAAVLWGAWRLLRQ